MSINYEYINVKVSQTEAWKAKWDCKEKYLYLTDQKYHNNLDVLPCTGVLNSHFLKYKLWWKLLPYY